MLIAVVKNSSKSFRKKVTVVPFYGILVAEVGERVSKRKISSLIKAFGGKYIAARQLGLKPCEHINTDTAREALLFYRFKDYLLGSAGKDMSVGIIDPDMHCLDLPILTRLVAHCCEIVICTDRDCDLLCKRLLLETGICPEAVSSRRHLMQCDCVFSYDGFAGFQGVLFGKGGITAEPKADDFPEPYGELLARGIDPVDLWCGLHSENLFPDSNRQLTRLRKV